MGVTADSVVVELEAKLDRYSAEIRQAVGTFESGTARIERSAILAEGATRRLGAGLGAAKAVLAGFAGGIASSALQTLPTLLFDAAKSAVDYAGSLGETSQQLGVTTKFLQEFRFGATQSGASTAQADTALAKFSRTIGEAANGSKTAVDGFRSIGVSVADASGNLKSTDELYRQVADAIARIPDPARQSAAAFEIFGKGASAILPLIKSGSAGFSEMAAAANKLGLVLSDKTIDGLDKLADKGAAVKQVITTQLAAAIGENADGLLALGDAAAGAVGKFAGLLREMRGVAALASRGDFVQILTTGDKSLERLGTAAGAASYDRQKVADLSKRIDAASKVKGSEPFVRELKAQLAKAQKQADASLEAGLAELFPLPSQSTTAPAGSGGRVISVADKPARARSVKAARPVVDRYADFKKDYGDSLLVDGPSASDALGKTIADEAARAAASARLFSDVIGTVDAEVLPSAASALGQMADEAERAQRAADSFKDGLATGLADAIVNGKSLGDVLVDSLKRAAAEAIASGIFKLLNSVGGSSGGGGALGSIFSGLGFAAGGSPPVGRISVVGERGPELFLPHTAGRIIPNSALGNAGGNQSVRVSVDVNPSPFFIVATRTVAAQEGGNAARKTLDQRSRRPIPRSRGA